MKYKTRIKVKDDRFYPQYRKWFIWRNIHIHLEGLTLEPVDWWVFENNAIRALNKFVSNGYKGDI